MRNLPASLHEPIAEFLRKKISPEALLTDFTVVGGGCINHCGKLVTSAGTFFLKWNDALKFPGMLVAEAKGLTLLRNPGVIHVPEVLGVGEVGDHQFMVMEYVHQHARSKNYWDNFGRHLATLHQVRETAFGLDHQNYMGSLQQFNDPVGSWVDFFIQQRLSVQVELAIANHRLPAEVLIKIEILYQKLPALLPAEQPSLLHGDLWSGNLIADEMGEPCLIDPAVYFGHREADLAMTQLFGGFDDRYMNSYHEVFPLTPGLSERIDLYNLYPLLVHVNLFGGGYVSQVNSILNRYID